MSAATSSKERRVAVLLVLCVVLVVFWELTSRLASRPFEGLRLNAIHFSGFVPSDPQWNIRLMHLKATPTEPTVIAYDARRLTPAVQTVLPAVLPAVANAPVMVRLMHGYNMVDCMRIKQYRVELLSDTRRRGTAPGADSAAADGIPVQVWRLTAPSGDRAVWVTTMLRATDFGATDTDTRDMAFPRVGMPDDPAWAPSGLKWSSFRHPVRNLRLYLRSKWNASRSDLLTFLRLRQPAWASDVMLTLVSEYRGEPLAGDAESAAVAHVLEVHRLFYALLRAHGGPSAGAANGP
jgi:hypothetical protein